MRIELVRRCWPRHLSDAVAQLALRPRSGASAVDYSVGVAVNRSPSTDHLSHRRRASEMIRFRLVICGPRARRSSLRRTNLMDEESISAPLQSGQSRRTFRPIHHFRLPTSPSHQPTFLLIFFVFPCRVGRIPSYLRRLSSSASTSHETRSTLLAMSTSASATCLLDSILFSNELIWRVCRGKSQLRAAPYIQLKMAVKIQTFNTLRDKPERASQEVFLRRTHWTIISSFGF